MLVAFLENVVVVENTEQSVSVRVRRILVFINIFSNRAVYRFSWIRVSLKVPGIGQLSCGVRILCLPCVG